MKRLFVTLLCLSALALAAPMSAAAQALDEPPVSQETQGTPSDALDRPNPAEASTGEPEINEEHK